VDILGEVVCFVVGFVSGGVVLWRSCSFYFVFCIVVKTPRSFLNCDVEFALSFIASFFLGDDEAVTFSLHTGWLV
jgi:hypothetical protein